MTKTPAGNWDPVRELTVLLDALTAEILGGHDIRVNALVSEREAKATAEGIRRLAAAADLASFLSPESTKLELHRHWLISRNQ